MERAEKIKGVNETLKSELKLIDDFEQRQEHTRKMLRGSLRRITTVVKEEAYDKDTLPTEEVADLAGNQTSNALANGLKLSSRLIPNPNYHRGGNKHRCKIRETSHSDACESQSSTVEEDELSSSITSEIEDQDKEFQDPLLDKVNEQVLADILIDLKARKS